MLQRIRDRLHGSRWLAWLALLPIMLIFSFWGGSNSLDFGGLSKQIAAKVDGHEIAASEATRAWSEAQSRYAKSPVAAQFGGEMPAEERTKTQNDILDGLVLQKLIQLRLAQEHYRVSDAKVFTDIQGIALFKDSEGKYSPAQARSVLRQYGKTEQDFFDETRTQLIVDQLQQGIGGSYFLTRAEAKRLADLENEEREVEYVELPADKFAGSAPPDDAAIQAFYEKNGDRFLTTESVALEYAELRLEQIASQVKPTEDDLRELYESSRANYVLEERRRAQHILIAIGDDDAAARKKAEAVLAEAHAGKDFAALAKKYSTDSTAAAGGELGFIERKNFPGPFADTLFAMKVGDVAGPVKSQFGYHIIKLEEIEAAQSKPFETVREELDSQYRKDRASELFNEREDDIGTALEKGTTDLDKIATDLGLTRASIPEFLRGGGAEPLGSSPELQQLVFGDAVLNQGKIGGPLPLGEDRMVLVKVTAHHKPAAKPLAVVRDEIVAELTKERGAAGAKAAADGAVAKLETGDKLESLAQAWGLDTDPAHFVSRGDPSIPEALRSAIFEAPRPGAKPTVKTVTLDDGSTAVFVVTRTRIGDTSKNPQLIQQQNAQLLQRSAGGDIAAYVDEAKRKAKIVKNPAVFE